MRNKYGQVYTFAYVDELPTCCMECPFLHVRNNEYMGIEKGYTSIQWCAFHKEDGSNHIMLEHRWRDKRDDRCPLKLISDLQK